MAKNPLSPVTVVGSTVYGTSSNTIFEMNPDGSNYQVLKTFGSSPTDAVAALGESSLVELGSKLFGTTSGGGSNGRGTIYSLNLNGSGFQIVHSFAGATEGGSPTSALTTIGSTLYGVADTFGGERPWHDLGHQTVMAAVFKFCTPSPNRTVLAEGRDR